MHDNGEIKERKNRKEPDNCKLLHNSVCSINLTTKDYNDKRDQTGGKNNNRNYDINNKNRSMTISYMIFKSAIRIKNKKQTILNNSNMAKNYTSNHYNNNNKSEKLRDNSNLSNKHDDHSYNTKEKDISKIINNLIVRIQQLTNHLLLYESITDSYIYQNLLNFCNIGFKDDKKDKKEKNKPKETNNKRSNNYCKPRGTAPLYVIFWKNYSNKKFISNKHNRTKISDNCNNMRIHVSLLLGDIPQNNRNNKKNTDTSKKKHEKTNKYPTNNIINKSINSNNIRFNQEDLS